MKINSARTVVLSRSPKWNGRASKFHLMIAMSSQHSLKVSGTGSLESRILLVCVRLPLSRSERASRCKCKSSKFKGRSACPEVPRALIPSAQLARSIGPTVISFALTVGRLDLTGDRLLLCRSTISSDRPSTTTRHHSMRNAAYQGPTRHASLRLLRGIEHLSRKEGRNSSSLELASRTPAS